jgi:hypothetical protein
MKIFILIGLTLCRLASYAQGGNWMISYPISFPTGDLHNYTSNVSFRGLSLEFNKKVAPQRTVGLETGWNVFYQHVDAKVYTDGTASISGVQYRYTNAVPIILGAKYYPARSGSAARPYIGFGLGTLYVDRSTDFGLYRINSDAWQFCIRPEAGVEAKVGPGESFFIGVKYFWAFAANGLDGQPYLTANIGFKVTAF